MDKTVSVGGNGEADNFVDHNSGSDVPETFLRKGHLLKNRYEVLSVLGQGGFGLTYACRDITLNLYVAVKEYYPDGFVTRDCKKSATVTYSTTPENMEFIEKGLHKFIDEARILAKFSGEDGIVDVRDYFEENNTAYIVMEYLDGKDLRQIIKEKGVMPADYAIRLLLPVMESLEKVHRQGLIHRDISPDNIRMVGKKVKLLDFGAARDYSFEGNKTMTVMLKRGYAPIEQYGSSEAQGPWTDVYALCATLYLCITGKKPADSLMRWQNDPLKKPSELGVAINPAIESVIMKGLSVLAKDRYQSMAALAYDFGRALRGGNAVSSAPVKKSEPQHVAEKPEATENKEEPKTPEKKKSKKKIFIPIIAVVLVVAILAGVLVLRHFGYFTPAYGGEIEMAVDEESPSEGATTDATEGTDSEESTTETVTEKENSSDEENVVTLSNSDRRNLEKMLSCILYHGWTYDYDNDLYEFRTYDYTNPDAYELAMSYMADFPNCDCLLPEEINSIYDWDCYVEQIDYIEDTSKEPDPRKLLGSRYRVVGGYLSDVIITTVFNLTVDESYEARDADGNIIAYYYDGCYYMDMYEYVTTDGALAEVNIKEAKGLPDGKYLIKAVYRETGQVSVTETDFEITAKMKLVGFDEYNSDSVWSIYKIEAGKTQVTQTVY